MVVLHITQHHRFWDQDTQSWIDAADLTPGHQLRTDDGYQATIVAVHSFTSDGHTLIRDLTIQTNHTYYVIAGTTPVLVHNDNGDWFPDRPLPRD